jgi:PKD repeat protein
LDVPPTAVLSSSTSDLTASFDGSGSTDRDGTVAGYAWDFGDGSTATGVTARHKYAAAGSYPVRLTVTDDKGATGTAAATVTVTAPPAGPGSIARDSFGREVASGWGPAEVGGAWTTTGTASVTRGAGVLSSAPGATTRATLGSVSRADVALQATVTVPQAPTGGGSYVTLGTRRVGSSSYGVKLQFTAKGSVTASLVATVAGADTVLGSYPVAAALPVGTPLTVRFQTSGSGTTTLAVSVWPSSSPRPASWGLVRTDTTSALQGAGGLFVQQYSSATATSASLLQVDDLAAEPAA